MPYLSVALYDATCLTPSIVMWAQSSPFLVTVTLSPALNWPVVGSGVGVSTGSSVGSAWAASVGSGVTHVGAGCGFLVGWAVERSAVVPVPPQAATMTAARARPR